MAFTRGEVPRKKYICKFCKVEVISKSNTRAVYMAEHKRNCPRRRNG